MKKTLHLQGIGGEDLTFCLNFHSLFHSFLLQNLYDVWSPNTTLWNAFKACPFLAVVWPSSSSHPLLNALKRINGVDFEIILRFFMTQVLIWFCFDFCSQFFKCRHILFLSSLFWVVFVFVLFLGESQQMKLKNCITSYKQLKPLKIRGEHWKCNSLIQGLLYKDVRQSVIKPPKDFGI